ncbi:MAG: glycosyltransferase family 20 protein [Anaerolineae bacterium]
MSNSAEPLIVIVSNRGPFSFQQEADGSFKYRRGQGGLVTALAGLMEHTEILWIASAISEDDQAWAAAHDDAPQEIEGTLLQLVRIDREHYDPYYNVISNPLLWFIQHQLWNAPRKPDIDKITWNAWNNGYVAVNQLMAEAVVKTVQSLDRPVLIFPQDYHLYMLPHFLRKELGPEAYIQPFIHIPWPGPDGWRMLPEPMRTAILDSLLQSNCVGFQTKRDAFNFVQTCRFYLEDAHSYGSRNSIEYHERKVYANAYPISIDVDKVQSLAEESETRLVKSHLINIIGDQKVILRVDRIEPSKNIFRGLQAFRELLNEFPEHVGRVQMLMLLVPSRMEVDEYQSYWQSIMAEAGMINAQFSDAYWEPVQVIVGDNYQRAIAAFQLYDVLMVNPITDGMNLVAKEGALVNQRNGVLLLSEHAGAFYELGDHALVVNPFDIYGTAQALHAALTMPGAERERRALALREQVQTADVRAWFKAQLRDARSSHASKSSTPDTPSTKKSAASSTDNGVSEEATPTPNA